MAITGALAADFSNFKTAADGAVAQLQAMEGASKDVVKALDGISDKGGDRFAASVAQLAALRRENTETAGSVNSLRQALGTFDGVLGSLGVNMGPAVRGLSEIGDSAGKSFTELGLLGAGGLALGAGMAGWQVGRAVADFFKLDAAIGTATATLLGYGDVAAETAGAKQDTINAAIRRGADAWITYTEAIAFNTTKQQEFQAEAQKADDALKRLDAPAKSAAQIAGWRAEIELVRSSGVIASLTADLASHNFTMAELAERYKISVPAVQEFGRELQKNDAIAKSNTEKIAALQKELDASAAKRVQAAKAVADAEAAAAQRFAVAMGEIDNAGQGWQRTLDTINGSVAESVKYYLAAGVSQQALAEVYGLTKAQVAAVTMALREETAAQQASTTAASAGTAATQTQTQALAQQIAMVHTLAGEYISLDAAQKLRDMGGSAQIPDLTAQQVELMGGVEEIRRQVALGRPMNPGTNTREGYADLARRQASFEAMVRYLSSLSYAGGSSPALPASATSPLGGSATTVTVNIQVSGVLDPRTIQDLSRGVGDELMKTLRLSSKF